MTTTGPPPGIYIISVCREAGVEPANLTRHGEKGVTILPPSAIPDPEQEWRIVPGKDGNIIIERPSGLFPTSYLTYEGAPKKPEQGDRILCLLSEFPTNEWHAAIALGFCYFLQVAGSDLGIKVAPPLIFPPFLELTLENQLKWEFKRVRDE